ncbi:MAG TPA: hypothetical protein VNL96_04165 [Gemmatimonadaceae bacterium]|nr:hypothetical protein [Gemmatimonadaceae bacterium]
MIKSLLRQHMRRYPRLDRLIRLYVRRRRALTDALPNWSRMLGQDRSVLLGRRQRGPRVLIATSVGGHWAATSLESALGAALTLRGAEAHVLLCDRALPACLHCDASWYPSLRHFAATGPRTDLCHHCFEPALRVYDQLALPVHRYSQYLTEDMRRRAADVTREADLSTVSNFRVDGIAVGEHALAGALRFFARATLEGEPYGESILRRYLHAAVLAALAVRQLLRTHRYDVAVFHHGIYVPQGLVAEACRAEGVRVVNWNPAYRKQCFIFSHHQTYHHALMTEPTDLWEDIPWSPERERELLSYLRSRWYGTQDWIWFHDKPEEDVNGIARKLGVDFSRPCVGLLTNVMWDAQLHYPANAFPSMLDWVLHTVRYFAARSDLQLVIRVHPAEIRGTLPSRQPLVAELRKAFPSLPPNVFVIDPESNVSTYAVMERCVATIIYGTKTGVELTSMGIPVIVAGEAWIRNKGLTYDASSVDEYDALLGRLPNFPRLEAETLQRARRYAYHFFFRRMIPLPFMEPIPGNPPYRVIVKHLSDLKPGASLGLDVICDGVLKGTEFVYPAERVAGRSLGS